MSASIQPRNGGKDHQLRVVHKLLPKDFFFTFKGEDSRAQAEAYRDKLTSMLAQGVVPQALLAAPARGNDPLVAEVISGYEKHSTVTDSDLALLQLIRSEAAGMRVSGITYEWVERWVRRLKVKENLAPGTIRKRVGALGRVLDWHYKRDTPKGQAMPANALRLLPRGYSQYTASEIEEAEGKGGEARFDEVRDRRLLPAEEARCRRALAGEKREDRERALTAEPEFTRLFDLIVDTGVRLSEALRLRVEHVDLERGVLRLQGSKATRGQRKPRVVPLKKHLRDALREQIGDRLAGLVFHVLERGRAAEEGVQSPDAAVPDLFSYAGVDDFTEHDLRHEATCRWFTLRNPQGGWMFSEIEVCRIMGWTSTKMALRYASLRGEDLADRLL
jgi:integrase